MINEEAKQYFKQAQDTYEKSSRDNTDLNDIIGLLNLAIDKSEEFYEEAHLLRAYVYMEQTRFYNALRSLHPIIEHNPHHVEASILIVSATYLDGLEKQDIGKFINGLFQMHRFGKLRELFLDQVDKMKSTHFLNYSELILPLANKIHDRNPLDTRARTLYSLITDYPMSKIDLDNPEHNKEIMRIKAIAEGRKATTH